MIVRVREWFGQRSAREQRLLLVMAVLAVPLLLWLALVVPLDRAYDRALERHLEAVDRRSRILALVAPGKGPPAPRAAPVADLGLFLADRARQVGLTVEPGPASAPGMSSVSITAADARTAFEWLRGLEAAGYPVADVRISPAANGQVGVTATIGGGR